MDHYIYVRGRLRPLTTTKYRSYMNLIVIILSVNKKTVRPNSFAVRPTAPKILSMTFNFLIDHTKNLIDHTEILIDHTKKLIDIN
jgi:hypothetical protein